MCAVIFEIVFYKWGPLTTTPHIHTVQEADHHHPLYSTQVQDKDTATCPSLPQDVVMCPPPPSGHCDVFSLPLGRCDVSSPPSVCCDVFSLRHRMTRCVLSPTQVTAQAVKVQKVDQHPLPPPEEVVHAVDEAAHHHPPHAI